MLRTPRDGGQDKDGREVGDDWLLADLGLDSNLAHVYLTTDHLHGSDVPSELQDATECAQLIVRLLNEHYAR